MAPKIAPKPPKIAPRSPTARPIFFVYRFLNTCWSPFGFFDSDALFQQQADSFAVFAANNVGYPISLSRGAYWLGRSYEKMNNKKESLKWYEEATKYLTTYYGQLAHLKIKPNEKFELNEQIKVDGKLKKKAKGSAWYEKLCCCRGCEGWFSWCCCDSCDKKED